VTTEGAAAALAPESAPRRRPARRREADSARRRATMRMSLLEGSTTQIFLVWTSGSVLTGYTLYLGGGPMELAAIACVPQLAQLSAPFAAWLQGMVPRRLLLITAFAMIGRFAWLLPALFPLLSLPKEAAVKLLIAVLALSSVFQSSAGAIWTAWMGEIVPERRRGAYFGFRNGVLSVVGMGSNLLGGVLLDAIPEPYNFPAILGVGLVCAATGIWLYSKHWQPAMPRTVRPVAHVFHGPLGDPNFRRLLVFAFYWQAAVLAGSPFVYPYLLDHLKMSYTQVAIWSSLAAAVTLLTSTVWGRIADRIGNKPVLMAGTIVAGSVLPLSWILATPENLTFIWVSSLMDALAWGSINPAIFNIALATAPRRNRIDYVSILAMTTGVAGFAGGMIAGRLMKAIEDQSIMLGGYEWTNYQTIFVLSGLMRCTAFLFLARVGETRAWSVAETWRAVRRYVAGNFFWR